MKKSGARRKPEALRLFDHEVLGQGFGSLAGVDEAGRGPLAGPVVAAAVLVRDFSFSASVDDSKKMSAAARLAAYDEIMAKCAVSFAVIDHEEIDRINIFQATMLAMQQAVARLPQLPDLALVDGPSAPRFGCAARAVVDGDALSFSIACASVVAKVTRDRLMEAYDGQYPRYGFARHKGYGTQQHLAALREHGPCRIHRRSFAPVKELWKLS